MVNTLPPLAANADVEAALGRALTIDEKKYVSKLIRQASAKMRAACHRPAAWTNNTTTSYLKVTNNQVYLPEPPVEIISITDEKNRPITKWEWHGQWLTNLGLPASSSKFVFVIWHHREPIPDDVRGAVAGMVARVLAADSRAAAGVSTIQGTAGQVTGTETFAAWAQGRQVLLSPDDLKVADYHRPHVPKLWVMQP